MFCREQSARLAERRDEIEATGAQLVAIGNGKPEWGKAFVESEGVDFPVYCDPGRMTYKEFGLKRGVRAVSGSKVVRNGARASAKGFSQTKTRGDVTQIGGVVVIDATGEVVWQHTEQEAGDLCDIDELLTALNELNT